MCSPVLRPSLSSASVDLCVTSCSSPKGRLSPDQPWSWSWGSDCARTCERSTVSHCACSKMTHNQRTAITANRCYYNILIIPKTVKKNFHKFYCFTVHFNSLNLTYQLMHFYRVSQDECARLRENVPYVKVYRHNPKHLCPKLNGYGDNGQRILKFWQLLHTYWLPNTY